MNRIAAYIPNPKNLMLTLTLSLLTLLPAWGQIIGEPLGVITSHPESAAVCEGESIRFRIQVEGSGYTYQWRKNGANIPGATSKSLQLDNVTADQAGSYSCAVLSSNMIIEVSSSATLTVNTAPAVIQQPVDQEACESTSATFSITTTGTPTYQWFKDGVGVSGAISTTYTIPNVTPGSAGAYTCVVSGSCGSTTSHAASLTVNPSTAIVITEQPQNQSACEGAHVSFSISATGEYLDFQWYRGGVIIPEATGSTLTLQSVSLNDAGTYTCTVSNACSSTTSQAAELAVAESLEITQQPTSQTVCSGESVTLSVATTGDGITYQWWRDGQELASAASPNLTIPSVTAEHAGSYTCTVTGPCGSETSTVATLQVHPITSIVQQPDGQSVCAGTSVSFSITALGENLSYQWARDGVALTGATSNTLYIPSASASDEGSYTCSVTGYCGNATSESALLTVDSNPDPVVALQPQSLTVCAGNGATLSITATGENLAYQWVKDGEDLPGANSNTLSFVATTAPDAGSYACRVSGTCATTTSSAATLTVNAAPTLNPIQGDPTPCERSSQEYRVNFIEGVEYQWTFPAGWIVEQEVDPKGPIPPGGAQIPTEWSNRVTVRVGSSSGILSVSARNGCNLISEQTLAAAVPAPPQITLQPQDQSACEGEKGVTFSVDAEGGNLSYQWYKDDVGIPLATNKNHTLPSVTFDQGGVYSCVVTGTCGDESSEPARLAVYQITDITEQPKRAEACEGGSFTLSVTAAGGELEYQWMLNGVSIAGATGSEYSKANATTHHSGAYTCIVTGACGAVTSEAVTVTVNTIPGQPSPIAGSTGVCQGTEEVYAVTPVPGVEYTWQLPQGWTVSPRDPGDPDGTVRVIVGETGGTIAVTPSIGECEGPSRSLSVSVPATKIYSTPYNRNVCPGNDAVFGISATGQNLTYQWFVNGDSMAGATGNIYTFANASPDDHGAAITCEVSGTCGSLTSGDYHLYISESIAITGQSLSQDVCEGSGGFFLWVRAIGTNLHYQWMKDGDNIAGANSDALELGTITLNDGGVYRCRVTGTCGTSAHEVLSEEIVITVSPRTSITQHPVSQSVCTGSSVSFSINAEGENLTYRWMKNGAVINGNAYGSTYTIDNALSADAGVYTCRVSSSYCETLNSSEATLTVTSAPTIIIEQQPESHDVCPGESITFNVVAIGSNLEYQWKKDGIDISNSHGASFPIENASSAHAGEYTCEVTGQCGSVTSSSATLTVGTATTITQQPLDQTIPVGGVGTFSVTASGVEVSYQWMKNGENIPDAISSSYSIPYASSSHQGTYKVRVSDSCGGVNESTSATLSVISPPSIVAQPVNQTITNPDQQVSFGVNVEGTDLGYLWQQSLDRGNTWYDISGKTDPTLTITGQDNQWFRCKIVKGAYTVYSDPAVLRLNAQPQLSSNANYIYSKTYHGETDQVNSPRDIQHEVSYFDGLGRVSQRVSYRQSPLMQDMILPVEYDDLGRQDKQYLPYPNDNHGGLVANAITGLDQYFQNSVPEDIRSSYPFAKTVFEPSPLNRVTEQGAPGEEWQPYDPDVNGSGHTLKYEYATNTATEVVRWRVNNNDLVKDSFYPAGSLHVTVIKDENWTLNDLHTTREYKDLQGRVVLKVSFVAEGESIVTDIPLKTFYVYDDLGLLRYVLSPEGTQRIAAGGGSSFTPNHSLIKQYCYYYQYDGRKRMTVKQLPGAAPVYMVYDSRDRLVLTQDGNLRQRVEGDDITLLNKWFFTKYDALNRPVITGVYTHPSAISQEGMQGEVNSFYINKDNFYYFEIQGNDLLGYTNRSFPAQIVETSCLTVTYYDGYSQLNAIAAFSGLNFDPNSGIIAYTDNDGTPNGYFDRVKGQVTGTRIKVLDGYEHSVQAQWTNSVTYYDNRYRPIQTRGTLYGGIDGDTYTSSTRYHFNGMVEQTRESQNFNGITTSINTFLTYDHAWRLTEKEQQIGDSPANRVTLATYRYNELGQQIAKNMGDGMQNVDYKYNIRGWLTDVNDVDNLGSDLFAMRLTYNGGDKPQWNGNISGQAWRHAPYQNHTDAVKQEYSYRYDALNRLVEGKYIQDRSRLGWYDERLSYDSNGNITTLNRYTNTSMERSAMDSLSYKYQGNRLINVTDAADQVAGFRNANGMVTTITEFRYDANGNMTEDSNKGIMVEYNLLNLPKKVNPNITSSDRIEYIYSAAGQKLLMKHTQVAGTQQYAYIGSLVYFKGSISTPWACEYQLTGEGRAKSSGTSWVYEYFLTDHLGNTRVVVKRDVDGQAKAEQVNDYYPFGMQIANLPLGPEHNRLKYNGKELQQFALNGVQLDWYDYGWRFYDPSLGRWHAIDNLAENSYPSSQYVYCINNPITFIDPDGDDWFYYKANGENDAGWHWQDGNSYDHSYTYTDENDEVQTKTITLQGVKAVVEFNGSYDEKLGSDGTLTGEGASPATVTVYGPGGSDDIETYRGLTITSDPSKYPMIENGTYSAKYQKMATSIYGSDANTYIISGRTKKTAGYPVLSGWFESNDLSPVGGMNYVKNDFHMSSIFIHRTDWNGVATKSSQGCLLIDGKQFNAFQNQLGKLSNFLVIVNRPFIPFSDRSSRTGIIAN